MSMKEELTSFLFCGFTISRYIYVDMYGTLTRRTQPIGSGTESGRLASNCYVLSLPPCEPPMGAHKVTLVLPLHARLC